MSKKNWIQMYQAGGPMPAGPDGGAAAPAPEASAAPAPAPAADGGKPGAGGADDLQTMLMQAYETQDPQLALQVVNKLVEQLMASQGGAPDGGAMPSARKGAEIKTPIFRKGGTLV